MRCLPKSGRGAEKPRLYDNYCVKLLQKYQKLNNPASSLLLL